MIVHNLNLQTPDGQKLTCRDVAWHIVNQTPEQQQLLQSQNRNEAQTHQLQQARAGATQALAKHAQRMQYAQHFQQTRGAVDQYAAAAPRFDELGDLIQREIKLGFDLDKAYRRAELLRPATAAQTRRTAPTRLRPAPPTGSIHRRTRGGSLKRMRATLGKPVSPRRHRERDQARERRRSDAPRS